MTAEAAPPRRPFRRRRAAAIVAVVALLVLAWAIVAAIVARGGALRARERLDDVGDPGATTDVSDALAAAGRDLRGSLAVLRQPGPALVARVPVLGRSWVALRRADEAALAVVEATSDVVATVGDDPLLDDGRLDLAAFGRLADALARAAETTSEPVRRLAAAKSGWTPPQVGRGLAEARARLGGAPDSLRRAAAAIEALRGVAGADRERRLLIVLQNNAELRGTGGLVSVFAEATARDGLLDVGSFRDINDVAESARFARPVPAPPAYVERYGRYLANTTLWRNANMSPDVPTSAEVMSRLATLSLGRPVDAVLFLDVRAITGILDATGPAKLADGRELDGDDALEELLVRAYAEAPDTRAGQDERRRRLRATADAVLERLFDGDAPAVSLGLALGRAAAGRHLAVWSAEPGEQAALVAAGIAGAVRTDTDDLVMVTAQNLGGGRAEGNKLDYYARREVSVDVAVGRETATTTVRFRLRNTAPAAGLNKYVAGLERPGESRSLLHFAVPAAAEMESFERNGQPVPTTISNTGAFTTLQDVAVLPPGGAAEWVLRYRVPVRDGRYDLRLVPQPLAFDAALKVRVRGDRTAYARAPGGALDWSGAWDAERVVTVDVTAGRWWQRLGREVREFWNEPVRLG